MTTKRQTRFVPVVEQLEKRLVLDERSAGYFGINSRFLTDPTGLLLTGRDQTIGQVENTRPYKPNPAGAITGDTRWHDHVNPVAIFDIETPTGLNSVASAHATEVAGVMIANGPVNKGVASQASLVASAYGGAVERDYVLSAQQVAGNQARPINYASDIQRRFLPADGTSLLSLGLDWLGEERTIGQVTRPGVLNVFSAGNRDQGQTLLDPDMQWGPPYDSYNGIVVGISEHVATNNQNVYRRFSPRNADPVPSVGERTLINLLAPSEGPLVPTVPAGWRRGGQANYVARGGSSIAAPHVTAAGEY